MTSFRNRENNPKVHAHTLHSALVSVTHYTQGERQVETGVGGAVGGRILMKVTKGGVSGMGGSAVGGWGVTLRSPGASVPTPPHPPMTVVYSK